MYTHIHICTRYILINAGQVLEGDIRKYKAWLLLGSQAGESKDWEILFLILFGK